MLSPTPPTESWPGYQNKTTESIICALPLERAAVWSMLDAIHDPLPTTRGDNNTYSYGCIGQQKVVIASLGVVPTALSLQRVLRTTCDVYSERSRMV